MARSSSLARFAASVLDRDRCLAGESYHDALGILGEDAGLGVTEEQPAQHARGTADDRDGKVARDRKMTMRHPVVRSVLAVARVLPHVVEPNDALPGERGCEQRGVAWCPELLEGLAGRSRQRVEQVVSALVVRRVVEECAELRAREDRRRVGHRLEKLLQLEFCGECPADLVDGVDHRAALAKRCLGPLALRHVARDLRRSDDGSRAVPDR
jgi:hypothetical protein